MARFFLFAVVISGCAILCSSCDKLVAVHCTPDNVGSFILLAGFDTSDVTSITIVKYNKREGLKTPIDTQTVKPDYSYSHGDTLFPGGVGLSCGYDWKVTVAPAQREWRVTDITYEDVVHNDRPSSIEHFPCYV